MPEGKGVLQDKTQKLQKLGSVDAAYAIQRLINSNGVAGGPNLPPRFVAGVRVPIVTGLKVDKVADYFGGTQITVSWLDVDSKFVNGYNVYVQNLSDDNPKPQGPYFTTASPATVRLVTNQSTVAVLTVQTLLNNGQTSEITFSPSVTATISAAASSPDDFDPNTIPVDAIEDNPAGSLLTWNASNEATLIGPGAADAIVVGSGAGAVPQFKSRATLDLVEGRSALTSVGDLTEVSAAGTIQDSGVLTTDVAAVITDAVRDAANLTTATSLTFVSAAGEIDQAVELSWDDGTKLLTQTQPTLGDPLQVLQSTASNTDPSETLVQNKVLTTNATPTIIHTLTIPASTTYAFSAHVVARRTGGASGTAEDGAFYNIQGVYKNVTGTATAVGAGTLVTAIGEDQAGWDVTFNPTGADVEILVTGAASNNVSWIINLRIYSVSS